MNKILISVLVGVFLVGSVIAIQTATAPHNFKMYEQTGNWMSCDNVCTNKQMFCATSNVLVKSQVIGTTYYVGSWEPRDCIEIPPSSPLPIQRTERCNCYK